MKKLNENLLTALISFSVFILFLIIFNILSSMMQSGIIPNIVFSQAVQGIMAFITFFPLLLALFSFGKFLETKSFYPLANILKFMSIGLFVFSIIQAILSLIGIYN